MPIIGIFIPNGDWQNATVLIGSASLKWGSFVSALVNFIIIAFVVFLIAKLFFKEKKVAKK